MKSIFWVAICLLLLVIGFTWLVKFTKNSISHGESLTAREYLLTYRPWGDDSYIYEASVEEFPWDGRRFFVGFMRLEGKIYRFNSIIERSGAGWFYYRNFTLNVPERFLNMAELEKEP